MRALLRNGLKRLGVRWIDLVALILALVFLSYSWWVPYVMRPALRYTNVPFPVINSPMKAGELLVIAVERCNDSREPITYSAARWLRRLDGEPTNTSLPLTAAGLPPGCERLVTRLDVIPANIPSGTYELQGISVLEDGRRVEWRTAPFVVE